MALGLVYLMLVRVLGWLALRASFGRWWARLRSDLWHEMLSWWAEGSITLRSRVSTVHRRRMSTPGPRTAHVDPRMAALLWLHELLEAYAFGLALDLADLTGLGRSR